jgi:hypothetical protein
VRTSEKMVRACEKDSDRTICEAKERMCEKWAR